MNRPLSFFLLFIATVLFQIFLFDNLSISIYFNPLIYIAFILLLPLNISRFWLLMLGLVTGWVMDRVMGSNGLNTLTILPLAFFRPWIVGLFCNKEDAREGGIPSPERFGKQTFIEYLVTCVLLHHVLFFVLESLSWANFPHTVLRIIISSAATTGFIWLITRVFTAKFTSK